MPGTIRASERRTRSHRRLLSTADENPLDGVANLFDATIVLSVALMIALLARPLLRAESLDESASADRAAQHQGIARLESVADRRERLERFRLSGQTIGGDGERLGIAYRLKSGEVICVAGESGKQ